jgi:uncharacterized repeat protein (TIGR03803 family)
MNRLIRGLSASMVGLAFASQFPAAAVGGSKDAILYSFGSGTDAQLPLASPIDVNGTLYGTTFGGGTYGDGAVFALVRKTGAETVLHSFGNGTDGKLPRSSPIDVKGILFGTTLQGGANGSGTVFSVNAGTGAETVLHSFGSGADGQYPVAGLIAAKGRLYGTTLNGGADGDGTVFTMDPKTGTESVLHAFAGGADGAIPYAGLIDVKGTLYGATELGGTGNDGIVFSLDAKTGAETILYSFTGGADGQYPLAGLIDVKGVLYGTTDEGGSNRDGTVFAVDAATGAETVLHSFGGTGDGSTPYASLIDVKGKLFGTTETGGASGDGTVFSVAPKTGAETVVYSFLGGTDGREPFAGLIDAKGTLYGTTEYGGTSGNGTVFVLGKH